MLSEQFKQMKPFLQAGLALPGDSYLQVREKMAPLHGHHPGEDASVVESKLNGVRCLSVETSSSKKRKSSSVMLMFHGGALVSCNADEYVFYAAAISRELNTRVLIIDYRLAPEHPYPSALDDCIDAYIGLLETGIDADDIGFIGDSCGGGLAICTLLKLVAAKQRLPACAISFTGWLDLSQSGDSALQWEGFENPDSDPFIHPQWIRDRGKDYAENYDLKDPLLSPVFADLTGLPPLLLQTGQYDSCRDDSTRLAASAAGTGVDVTLEVYAGMIHGFHGLDIPEAQSAYASAKTFFYKKLRAS